MAIIIGDQNPGNPNDSLTGTTDADEIYGLTGNDTIVGSGGGDSLFGGAGDDLFRDARSDDTLSGGEGYDRLVRNDEGVEELFFYENLILDQATSIEEAWFSAPVYGVGGDNLFDLTGVQKFTTLGDLDGRTGIFLKEGDDTFLGGAANDVVYGGEGDDLLRGGGGNDTLDAGDNFNEGGQLGARDTLDGGDGDDTLIVDRLQISTTVILGGDGYDTLRVGAVATGGVNRIVLDAAASIEAVAFKEGLGTSGNDLFDLTGTQSVRGQIDLLGGADTFLGGSGSEAVDGGAGADLLNGGGGDDRLLGGADNDTLIGGGGRDFLDGGSGDDVLIVAAGDVANATLAGGGGVDELQLTGAQAVSSLDLQNTGIERLTSAAISGTSAANSFNLTGVTSVAVTSFSLLGGDDTFIGGAAAETVDGGEGDDSLLGGGGGDRLSGGAGDDTLSGSAGVLDGGADDDRLVVRGSDLPNVTLLGGAGEDTLELTTTATAGVKTLDLDAAASIETLVAGDVYGTAGADRIDLSGFRSVSIGDVLLGGGGDAFVGSVKTDVVFGGADKDTLAGGAGADSLMGDDGDDQLTGDKGADSLLGGAGKDLLDGSKGNDWLIGGAGKDVLTGGAGQDSFVFDTAPQAKSADVITDFSVKNDQILIVQDVFRNLDFGPLAKDAFVTGKEAKDAQDRFIYNEKTGALWFDLDGSGRGEKIKIATLEDGLALTHRDFEVI